MKNSNIIVAITKKASQLYATFKFRGRVFWNEAMKQAAKLVKAVKEGVVTFWKLKPNQDGEHEITNRRVATLESIGYVAKTQSKSNGLIKLVDLAKYELFNKGESKESFIISFYPFQIV
jgi:hypothetical protein